jgi:hypothetical protein
MRHTIDLHPTTTAETPTAAASIQGKADPSQLIGQNGWLGSAQSMLTPLAADPDF